MRILQMTHISSVLKFVEHRNRWALSMLIFILSLGKLRESVQEQQLATRTDDNDIESFGRFMFCSKIGHAILSNFDIIVGSLKIHLVNAGG